MSQITKAIIYCRVSTEEQHERLDNQKTLLTQWAQSRGWDVIKIYEEEASAWKAGHQKQLSLIMKEAQRKNFEILLVWALDRLSREGALVILSQVHKFAAYGVRVISHQESWTEFPHEMQDILFALTGWAAKMESDRRSARTKLGMDRARREGRNVGRPQGARDKGERRKGGYYLRYRPNFQ